MKIKRRTKGEAALARTDQHVATAGRCNRLIHIWIAGQPAPVATPGCDECQTLVDRYNSMRPKNASHVEEGPLESPGFPVHEDPQPIPEKDRTA
jgi:hypothetical protein